MAEFKYPVISPSRLELLMGFVMATVKLLMWSADGDRENVSLVDVSNALVGVGNGHSGRLLSPDELHYVISELIMRGRLNLVEPSDCANSWLAKVVPTGGE